MSERTRRRLLSRSKFRTADQTNKKSLVERLSSVVGGNTAIFAAVASVALVANTLWEAHGKYVVLPFQVRGDIGNKSTFGESLAAGISRSINQFNYIYTTDFTSDADTDPNPKFEVIPSYLSQIPLSDIPRAVSISEATTLSRLTLFGINIPLGEIIFNHLALFHQRYIRGTIETWGGESIVSVEMGDGQKFVLSAGKKENVLWIIDMISAEVLNREKWLALPPPTKTPALMYFTRGLSNYIEYSRYGDQKLLESAKEDYKNAIDSDPGFALARLHLAAIQYSGWNSSDLLSSISNFSALTGNRELQVKAKIGLAAALLRHIERDRDCQTYDRDLERASAIANDIRQDAGLTTEELVLKASVSRTRVDRALNNAECRDRHRPINPQIANGDSAFNEILVEFDSALNLLKHRTPQDYRNISILLMKKYALEDMADYLISVNKISDAMDVLYTDKEVSKQIIDGVDRVPAWQVTMAFPYLKGTMAELNLKFAYVDNALGIPFTDELKNAEVNLVNAEYGGQPDASQWSLGRIGELLYSEGRVDEAVDALNEYINLDQRTKKTINYFESSSAKYSAMIEDEDTICDVVSGLTDLVKFDQRSVFQQMILADIYLEHGNVLRGKEFLESAEFSYSNNHLWYGHAIEQLLELLRIDLKARQGLTDEAFLAFKKISNYDPNDTGPYRIWLATLPNYLFVSALRTVQMLSQNTPLQQVVSVTMSNRPVLGELVAAQGKKESLECVK